MEQDAFPRFLRAKAFGNLTPVSALVRLIAGLVILWIGLAVGFSLIFLDVQPKSKRFFLFIPYTLAVLFLISHQYELDPVLVFFGQSESTPFRTLRIREPYVKKLLLGRAIWVTVYLSHQPAAPPSRAAVSRPSVPPDRGRSAWTPRTLRQKLGVNWIDSRAQARAVRTLSALRTADLVDHVEAHRILDLRRLTTSVQTVPNRKESSASCVARILIEDEDL
ncbi:hypothetical protein NUW54_g13154 [Trametes sanguinea]|uniref:Uncharacterized protein n=1 Tax=Trametes sanguinea TaxID=158606 RepID=A0ACC1MPV6_9APHY|nr:hypothetical protein NUW54_g13154 [Trametes sanguinea]